MSALLSVESRGIKFNVRIVNEGDNYGLNNCLTHEQKEPLVEFYDARYPHTEFGQFVSRYNMNTLINRDKNYGLDLDGGVPDWKIELSAMTEVLQWLDIENKSSKKLKM